MNRNTRHILVAAIVLTVAFNSQSADGQMIKEVLRRMDRDQNGYIGPDDEMTPQLAVLVEKYGYDADDWVEISALLNTIEERNNPAYQSNYLKKLPGFGNGNDGDTIDTPGFGTDELQELTDEELYSQYSEGVLEQMQQTLNRLDDDGNGFIDQVEAEDGNWRNPPFAESDINGDGAMTKTELAKRYHAREVASQQQEQDGERRDRRGRRRDRGDEDEGNRDNNNRQNDNREVVVRPAPPANNFSNNNNQQIQERAQRYVNGMFERYDKNNDGVIDEEEKKDMRRPPSGADADGDGQFTREEVFNFSSGTAQQQRQRIEQRQQTQQADNTSNRSGQSEPRSPGQRRRSGSFSEYDQNNDGQIQMHEFSDEWDGAVFEDYQRRDQNNDGVITPEEWSSSSAP